MFPARYYPNRFYPGVYFPNVGAVSITTIGGSGFVSTMGFEKVTIHIYNYELTGGVGGKVTKSYNYNYIINNCVMYEGSQAEKVVKEVMKTEVSAIVMLDYFSGYETKIKEKDKLVIDSKSYAVMSVSNVGKQNKVLQVAIKDF